MDISATLTGIGALVVVSAIIAVTIRALGNTSDDPGLAILFAPLVSSPSPDRHPVIREPEPTPWRLDLMAPRPSAPARPATSPTLVPPVHSGAGFARSWPSASLL